MTETATEEQPPEQDGEEKPKRRRSKGKFLAPTGEGPLEVTPETVGEGAQPPTAPLVPHPQPPADSGAPAVKPESTAETADAATVVKVSPSGVDPHALLPASIAANLEAELPEPDAEPAVVITAVEQRLHAAGLLQEAMQKKTLTAYFYYAGPAVRLAASGHWQHILDPSTGKPFRSWSAWLRSVKVSRQHAYRMTKEEPLLEALTEQGVTQLSTTQIDALSPVLTQHGAEAVGKVWAAAVELGDTSGPSLLKLRAQLGYEPKQAAGEEEEEPAGSNVSLPVLRFQTRPGVFDAQQVRQAARAQPEIARLVAREILLELGEEAPGVVSADTTPSG